MRFYQTSENPDYPHFTHENGTFLGASSMKTLDMVLAVEHDKKFISVGEDRQESV